MPKIKAHVIKLGKKDNRFWFKTDGLAELIGGFGSIPEDIQNAYDNQEEIEIEYHIVESNGKVFYNYGPERKKQLTENKNKTIEEMMKILVLPKLSVGIEKTIQETQFEPKKISVFISKNVENVDPKTIKAMIKLAEDEINEHLGITKQQTKEINKEENEFISKAVEEGFRRDIEDNKESLIEEGFEKASKFKEGRGAFADLGKPKN